MLPAVYVFLVVFYAGGSYKSMAQAEFDKATCEKRVVDFHKLNKEPATKKALESDGVVFASVMAKCVEMKSNIPTN